jgi:hypothetical protein
MTGPELLSVAQSYVDNPAAPAVYKLRAECWVDAMRLLSHVCPDRVSVSHLGLGEVEILLENPSAKRTDRPRGQPLSLEELRYLIGVNVRDSHVMIETLRVANEYTGDRTYARGGSWTYPKETSSVRKPKMIAGEAP